MKCVYLTSENHDLASSVLTQKVLHQIISHRKQFGCCKKKRCKIWVFSQTDPGYLHKYSNCLYVSLHHHHFMHRCMLCQYLTVHYLLLQITSWVLQDSCPQTLSRPMRAKADWLLKSFRQAMFNKGSWHVNIYTVQMSTKPLLRQSRG